MNSNSINRIVIILALLLIVSIGYSQENNSLLKDVYKDEFKIGFSIGWNHHLKDTNIIKLVAKEYNVFTPENPLKWTRLVNEKGEYDFSFADEMVDFAEKNNLKVVGHTLIWYRQTPKWVFKDENGDLASKELVMTRMEAHIKKVVGRYKGRIYAWDVVNEAVDPDGKKMLRDSEYLEIFGDEEFIELAFKWAHEANPEAKLYYNDYSCFILDKRNHIFNLMKRLLDKGTPIDGIGMQSHYNVHTPSVYELRETFELFKTLGIEINISELDMGMYSFYDRKANQFADSIPNEMLIVQAFRYAKLFDIYKEYSDIIDRVTFWGTTDKYSWLNGRPFKERIDYPLLFDRNGKKKPAYWAVTRPDDWCLLYNDK